MTSFKTDGRDIDQKAEQMAMLWILNLSDGYHSLQDIVELSCLDPVSIARTAEVLVCHGLLEEILVAEGC
jgi:aminopeptidase-like protein